MSLRTSPLESIAFLCLISTLFKSGPRRRSHLSSCAYRSREEDPTWTLLHRRSCLEGSVCQQHEPFLLIPLPQRISHWLSPGIFFSAQQAVTGRRFRWLWSHPPIWPFPFREAGPRQSIRCTSHPSSKIRYGSRCRESTVFLCYEWSGKHFPSCAQSWPNTPSWVSFRFETFFCYLFR